MARRVFLHIGAPKSGTTFVQEAMARNHERLAQQGVLYAAGRYPADRVWATEVLRGLDHSEHPQRHAAGAWDRILEQVDAWDRTAVVSHEFFGACSAEQARRALHDLSPAEVHLIFTARDYVRQTTAAWQERLKYRHRTPLGEFSLDDVHGTPVWSWTTHDVVAILDRWGRDLRPERVHVVTVPQPEGLQRVLWERFASVIGVDPALCDASVERANASLGVVEAELLRRVNERLGEEMSSPREAARWVRDVLADRILAARKGDRFGLEPEVAAPLRKRSLAAVEELSARGYDVVGDLADLVSPEDHPVMRHPDEVSDVELLGVALDTIARMLREVKQQTQRAQQAERAAKEVGKRLSDERPSLGAGRTAVSRDVRQILVDLSEQRPAAMKARVGYRRVRNAVRRAADQLVTPSRRSRSKADEAPLRTADERPWERGAAPPTSKSRTYERTMAGRDTPGEHDPAAGGRSEKFFDDYPRFLETSQTAAGHHRLRLRHAAMIDANRDILDGARVLDVASHDGRWSFAALKAGARHVTGVEARRELVDQAEKTFATYGTEPDSYRFVYGDVFEVLARERFEVDVVLCLGFFYHTLRYPELLAGIRRLNPTHLVLDTKVALHEDPVIKLTTNSAKVESHAVADGYSSGTETLAGWPSMSALTQMFRVYGFDVEHTFDWAALLGQERGRGMRDYTKGERVTLRLRSR